jgi:D-amino-acid dehydrogenase
VKRVETVVVGGGIVGWSASYHLIRHGQSVMVIDRADPGQATAAGAGIISPGSSIRMPKATLPLSRAAVSYYRELIPVLMEDGQIDTGFASPGTLFVFQNEDEMARMGEVESFARQLKADGFGSIGEISVLAGQEAKSFFPPLADLPGAIHFSEGSRVDGRKMRDALRAASLQRGAQEIHGGALWNEGTNRWHEIRAGNETVSFASLLIAGGAWAPELTNALAISLPVSPQRGQILHFDMRDTDTSGWSIIHGFHNHYLLAFAPSRVVAGATREDGSGFDYRQTAGGIYQELGEALRVAPGLAQETLAEIRVGFRPFSADTLPVMGRVPGHENVYVATGHGPSGLQLGPVSAAMVANDILGVANDISIEAYSPARFTNG